MAERLNLEALEKAFYSLEETIKQLSDLEWFYQQKVDCSRHVNCWCNSKV